MLALVYLVLLAGGATYAVDLTLEEKATGSAVVDAVVDIISQSCVFDNDRLMLRRIAYAETVDGTASFTFSIDGGIWQVDENSFTSTQASLSGEVEVDIQTEFSISWKQVTYRDLLKPLYSGIAAMLKITAYYSNPGNIPQQVSAQAAYWSNQYTINNWNDATATYTSASAAVDTTCSSPKADVVFTVDGSGSIGPANFASVKSFIEDVVDTFDISQQKVRVGLIEFSSTAVTQFDLQQYDNKAAVKTAVAAMQYVGEGTNSAAGLNVTTNMIEQQGRQQDGVPVVTIFLTDGKSNDQTATKIAANDMHTTLPQVTVFAIGVGSGIDVTELRTIASEPKCIHVYTLVGFDDITAFTNQIMNGACKAPAELIEGREITGSVTKGQYYYFKIKAKKSKDGVRIQLKATAGGVDAFYSWKVQNPSEALYNEKSEVRSGSVSVHIGWSAEAEKNAESVTVSGSPSVYFSPVTGNTLEAPLYGAIVGAEVGQNDFTLSYTDAGFQQTAGLLSLLAAFFALTRNHM